MLFQDRQAAGIRKQNAGKLRMLLDSPAMKVDLLLDAPAGRAAARARALATTGAAGLFTFEGPHDVFFPLVEAASAVDLDLMTNVAIALPRSPLHLAHSAWDLQVASGGRFRLGIGSQIRPHIENRYGATWNRPAARMREIVLAIKAIFSAWDEGTRLDFRGEFTRHTLMPPTFVPPRAEAGPPPVYLGGLGPVMVRTAAEVADGLLVMPFNTRRHYVERTLPAVEEGLARSGRSREELTIVPQAIVATGRTPGELRAARDGVRALLAFYASTPAYRHVLEVEGWGELQPELNAMSKSGDYLAMIDRIDDTMVATIGVSGTPEECAAEIRLRFGPTADRVAVYFPGYDVKLAHVAELVAALG